MESATKSSLNFCANLSFMFVEVTSLLERYDLAKKAGFKAVECAFPYDYPPEEIAKIKKNLGLQQVLINAYPGDWGKGERGLAAIPGKTSEFQRSLEKAIEYCKALDCEKLHIMSGVVHDETHEHMQVYKENMSYAASILSDNKIIGVIEPINKYSLPHYYLNDYNKAISIIKDIDSPNLQLLLDIYHLQLISGNITKNIIRLLPFVGHIQVAQVPDRQEPNTPGEIDYKYVFSLLENLEYQQWIGLEYTPKSRTFDGLHWITDFGYDL